MHSIYLVGFMGCGKTTVGRLLAERLGWSFIDLDDLIVEAEGRRIPEIFAEGGEAAFRTAERQALSGAVSATHTVVATGGGLFSDSRNRGLIADNDGWSVFLDVPWTVLESRIGQEDSNRPMWDSLSSAQALFKRRVEDYRMADVVVTVGGSESPSDVAQAVILLSPELACAI